MDKITTSSEDQLRSQYDVSTIRVAARSDRAGLPANASQEGNALMGEVRVKVKLTNGVDEAMVRRGLLTADKIRSYEAEALVDTGAVRSVLPIHVVQLLGLAIVDKARATYANDAAEDVDVTEMVGIRLLGRRTSEETLVLGSEVLIGQTVLESLDLQVDCTNQRVIPNPAHPDQPMIKIKMTLPSRSAVMNKKDERPEPTPEEVELVVTQEDYGAGLKRGWTDDDMLKPGRYKMKRGGFLKRHPELKLEEKKRA